MPKLSKDIVEHVDDLFKIVESGGVISKKDEAFLLDAEEVMGVSLNQIDFIKTVISDREEHT